MVKKLIIIIIACIVIPDMAMSQKRASFLKTQTHRIGAYLRDNQVTEEMKPFQHIDVAVTGSTAGIGFDLATPLCKWAQMRVGGVFRPYATYHATFGMQMGEDVGIQISESRFKEISRLMKTFTNTTPQDNIQMAGDLKMNNFKFLIDIYPIKKHRNFHVTVGFYYGNSTLIEANALPEFLKTQSAINTFNKIYKKALGKESLMDIEGVAKEAGMIIDGSVAFASAIEQLRQWGSIKEPVLDANGKQVYKQDEDGNWVAQTKSVTYRNQYIDVIPGQYVENRYFTTNGISIGLGKYSHEIIATEDIYYDYSVKLDNPYYIKDDSDPTGYHEEAYARDANGTEIKEGNIRYHKGDVIYKAGDDVRLTPDEANQLSTTGECNKFKPYLGIGYTLPLTKDKRTCLSIDVAALFWGGVPSINTRVPIGVNGSNEMVYQSLDLTQDVNSLPGSVQDYVNILKHFPVFPEIGIRLSHRLW